MLSINCILRKNKSRMVHHSKPLHVKLVCIIYKWLWILHAINELHTSIRKIQGVSYCIIVYYCLMCYVIYFLEIQKVLTKLSKEKGCEIIGRWRKACVGHFYWAVTSTQEHLGEVKLAKFHAFLSHVINKHKELPNRLFNACAHGNITTPRVWMHKGTTTLFFHYYYSRDSCKWYNLLQ